MNQFGCFLILLTWNIKLVLSHWCNPKPRYGGKVLAWVSYKPGNLRKNRLKPSKARVSKRKFCTNRNSTMLIFRCFQIRPVQISFTFNQLKCAKKILSKSLTPRQTKSKKNGLKSPAASPLTSHRLTILPILHPGRVCMRY